jgi:membrane-bound ClpP family serine protease
VVGAICLVLAFYALGVLDAYWGGIALMLLAVGLFVAGTSQRRSAVSRPRSGGACSGLNHPLQPNAGVQVDRGLIVAVAAGATAFSVFILGAIIRGQRRQKATAARA